jgi:8-oxo-dGTP pyrophosphatase MutT (NUDIX family)
MPRSIAQILEDLDQHCPWDAIEAEHRAKILDLFGQSSDPMDSVCFEPGHATGSAWIFAPESQQVAMIYHQKLQRWLQPGGHADPEEIDLRATAVREVEEEVGLRFDPAQVSLWDLDVHRIPENRKFPSHLHFDFRYLCISDLQPLRPDSDAVKAQWFSVVKLQQLDLDPGINRMIAKSIQKFR